jgi:hypothetical protein
LTSAKYKPSGSVERSSRKVDIVVFCFITS